jgi:preprotein translocase subunit SecF
MTSVFSFRTNVFAFTLVFAVISTITYAFASSTTGSSDPAGYGAEFISGYVITNVTYEQGNDPAKIKSTSFTLDTPAAKVQIKLSDRQSDWYDCTNVSGNNWTCDTDNHPITSANELQVVALGN